MKNIFKNFLEVFSKWQYLLLSLIIFIGMSLLFNWFTEHDLIAGNMGKNYLLAQVLAQYIISFLFALFVPITVYKIKYFNSFSVKENISSSIGAFLGVLVMGCPACSITLASYLGLSALLSFLPWYGLEIKLLAIPLLIYANLSSLNGLTTCKIKKQKKT